MNNFLELQDQALTNIYGGGGNIGSAIGGCIGGVLLAAAGGPITGGAAAFVCIASGIATGL